MTRPRVRRRTRRPTRRLLASLALLALGTAAASPRGQESPIDPERAALYFSELAQLSEQDGGQLWGTTLDGPLLFADPATRTVAANQADMEGQLEHRDGVYSGRLPDEVGIANTGVEWAGVRWTMVMWPPPDGRYDRGRLLTHESFHRMQPDLGFPANNPQNTHLDDERPRFWMRMEMRALAEALIREGSTRQSAVRDALLFRAARRAEVAGAAQEEGALEMNEGLAEYTGLRLGGLPNAVLRDRAALALERAETQASLSRSFAYATGPAWALLLDELSPGWRASVVGMGSLSDRVAEVLGVDSGDLSGALAAAHAYDGAYVAAAEAVRATEHRERLAVARARFVDGPTLRLPVGESFGYTFDPRRVTALDDVGQVYGGPRVVDDWGVLEVDGDALLVRGTGGRITQVRVAASPTPETDGDTVRGPDWVLTLNPGWSLVADGEGYRIEAVDPG